MTDLATLRAVLERIVPPDRHEGALGFGAEPFVVERLRAMPDMGAAVDAGLTVLAAAGFAALDAAGQDRALSGIAAEPWFLRLAELTAEGVYADPGNGGNPGARSWDMVGYQHRLPDGPDGPPPSAPRPPTPFVAGTLDYDVIIVGAGAGGGSAAAVLAEAGKHVLLIERGLARSYADSGHRDHLRNHRLSLYGHNTGPELDGNPRVLIDTAGQRHVLEPHQSGYQNNAAAVGSGTFVYGAQAWRFHRDDFQMASRYGVPEGSSLTDWPIGYDDLAPWYERAEWEIGVSGDASLHSHEGLRNRPYPMPALPPTSAHAALARGATALGISHIRPPLLINSVPRGGRDACIACASCVGFPCPSNAKNGTQNTMIPRALATGRCVLLTGTMVHKVETDAAGKVTGVSFTDSSGRRQTVHAKAVVLAGGAIETARLLLASPSARQPNGLGNDSDLVGRNLQGHVYPTAFGLFDEEVHTSDGPGVSIATTHYNHDNPGVIGGGMLANDFVQPPILFWKSSLPPDLQRWGLPAKDFMRDAYRRVLKVTGPVHEIPDPTARVQLSKDVRDRWGEPVVQLSGRIHPETLRTAGLIHSRALDWLTASSATKTWGTPPGQGLSGGQHQAGTARMGTDPANSVTDSFGRVWGHDNLVICDGAVHPTNGGFNPVLTIMSLALRSADALARGI